MPEHSGGPRDSALLSDVGLTACVLWALGLTDFLGAVLQSEARPPSPPSLCPFTGVPQLEASPGTLQFPLPLILHRHSPQ